MRQTSVTASQKEWSCFQRLSLSLALLSMDTIAQATASFDQQRQSEI